MRIYESHNVPAWAGDTKTMQTVGTMLKEKPHRLSQVVRIRPDLSANMLTDGMMNVVYKQGSKTRFDPISSFKFEWKVQTNNIVKVLFAEDCTDNGEGGTDMVHILKQKYYDKNDTYRLQNGQLVFVRDVPQMLSANRWKHVVVLVGSQSSRKVDTRYTTRGSETMYISNYFPELSERGYSKFTMNTELHQNYISRHRHSESWSSDFGALKDVYMQLGKDQNSEFFKMTSFEKFLMDQFLATRNNNLLFGVSNYDANGKCTLQERDGRDIPMGDGIITQIARYCDKYAYSRMTIQLLQEILFAVAEKTGKPIGNTVGVVVNSRLWQQIGQLLKVEYGFVKGTDSALVNKNGQNIKIGGTFNAYEFQGNTIIFTVDSTLTKVYDKQGFGICVDMGVTNGDANISLLTLAGRETIYGTVAGLGGLDGKTSGPVTTGVDGSEGHLIGYSGVAVLNPYAALMIRENVMF
ncbi:hypothetical protein [Hymenobacter siberiensis]|uniref:hypothetical protein n=1 Tax=Hymenobacter siberiensis TaxID=2848396 RepID=UPI001C1E5214|nr:hypothetical protein [Hymenobacter siberiensis]